MLYVRSGWLAHEMHTYREESSGVISVALYTTSECAAIVAELKQLQDWKPARVRHAQDLGHYDILTQPEVRSASTLVSKGSEKFYRDFDMRMNETVKPLILERWEIALKDHSGTHILKYGPGDHYVPHQDTGPGLEHRYLSIVCYLNDDFSGGQTSFPGRDYTVVPEAGKAIVFPSSYLHGSKPVRDGEKFVLVSWAKGPTAVKWI